MYCQLMTEVKGRMSVLESVINKKIDLTSDLARFEFSALLLRKSLEQIALASLISNRVEFCKAYTHFESAWNARLILQDIERVNPQFYPRPVEEVGTPEPGKPRHMRGVSEGFLTREEFVKVYDKCAALLHAPNPYGSAPDLAYFDTNIPLWRTRIFRLLDRHMFVLAGSNAVYLVQMHEEDGRVHHYTLSPHGENQAGLV
jgi:hypothetical protein